MLVNILLAIVFPLVKVNNILLAIICHLLENILMSIVLPLVNAGEYFDGYCLAISEFSRNFFFFIVLLLVNAEFFFTIVLLLVNAEEYFVGYCLAIIESLRIFYLQLSNHNESW